MFEALERRPVLFAREHAKRALAQHRVSRQRRAAQRRDVIGTMSRNFGTWKLAAFSTCSAAVRTAEPVPGRAQNLDGRLDERAVSHHQRTQGAQSERPRLGPLLAIRRRSVSRPRGRGRSPTARPRRDPSCPAPLSCAIRRRPALRAWPPSRPRRRPSSCSHWVSSRLLHLVRNVIVVEPESGSRSDHSLVIQHVANNRRGGRSGSGQGVRQSTSRGRSRPWRPRLSRPGPHRVGEPMADPRSRGERRRIRCIEATERPLPLGPEPVHVPVE